ncbi:MAG: prepilin-type N-terminal cleavage/methylation domain-containing protein [Thermoproteota archaeon]|jgi:prepilin-type N-terminal cleavage/methylation domain-containing protein
MKNNNKGFSLLEVLIALVLFSTFVVSYLTAQGYNVNDSINVREELILKNLAELKMNEIIINPPEFTAGLATTTVKKNFELEDYKDYRYEIIYKKIEVPDFTKLTGAKDGEDGGDEPKGDANIQKIIMEKLKTNIEKIIWQVQITIRNTTTDSNFTISAWISDPDAKMDLNLGM